MKQLALLLGLVAGAAALPSQAASISIGAVVDGVAVQYSDYDRYYYPERVTYVEHRYEPHYREVYYREPVVVHRHYVHEGRGRGHGHRHHHDRYCRH